MVQFFNFTLFEFVLNVNPNLLKIKHLIEEKCDFDIILDYEKTISFLSTTDDSKNADLIIHKCGYKIPGTDGVRAIALNNVHNSNLLKDFLKNNILSPSFVKHYVSCFIKMLPFSVETITVAEDGRELLNNNNIKDAVIDALVENGVKVIDLEIVPTPFLVAYSVEKKTPAIMITASHNPPEYNGIKLFIDGKKLYPFSKIGEYQLTYNFFTIKMSAFNLKKSKTVITPYPREIVSKIFSRVNFSTLKKNLKRTPIYLDLGHGAFSKVAKTFLQSNNVEIVEVACDLGVQRINENSGVALLENLPFKVTTSNIPILKRLIEDGKKYTKNLYAIVCDGDGDRAFILKYSSIDKTVSIFNGDMLGYIIAKSINSPNKKGQFCLTIESDFALSNVIKRELNWETNTVGVGDRWLIKKVNKDSIFVGCERSGHVIVKNNLFSPPLLTGNGLLTALLALQAGLSLYDFGYNKKLTSYNFPLESFYNGSESWNRIQNKILDFMQFKFKEYSISYEYNVLIFKVLDRYGDEIGLIYVRKSGTEPKISVSLSTIERYKQTGEELIKSLEEEFI